VNARKGPGFAAHRHHYAVPGTNVVQVVVEQVAQGWAVEQMMMRIDDGNVRVEDRLVPTFKSLARLPRSPLSSTACARPPLQKGLYPGFLYIWSGWPRMSGL
jgi:hypothetical protein